MIADRRTQVSNGRYIPSIRAGALRYTPRMGMGTRSGWLASILLVASVGHAWADAKGDINKKLKEAMEAYDLMDYGAAKKNLDQALAISKKNHLDKDALTARIYLDMGIAAFANSDVDGAKVAFLSAVQIDPKIQIEAAYKSPELTKLLDEARSEANGGGGDTGNGGNGGGGGGGDAGGGDEVDCASVKGLQHTILDSGKIGVAQPIVAYLGGDVAAVKVSVMYRPEGATDFSEAKLAKSGGCKYAGSIPSSGMKGSLVHYYVAAFDNNNKPLASKGSAGSPNIMELTAAKGGGGGGDNEDPINGTKGGGGEKTGGGGGDVSGGVIAGGKPARIYIGVTGGTGFGYVTGNTEGGNTVKNPGIANSLVVITPEIGFKVNAQLAIGVAGRLGLPIGANIDGHSPLGPAGLLRVRYALSGSGDGVRVMGQIGAGIMRNTLKLDNNPDGMNVDIVAQGPLLIGAGIGYTKTLGGNVAFVFDFSALGGIAVVKTLGAAPALNSGVTADLSLGLQVGF